MARSIGELMSQIGRMLLSAMVVFIDDILITKAMLKSLLTAVVVVAAGAAVYFGLDNIASGA